MCRHCHDREAVAVVFAEALPMAMGTRRSYALCLLCAIYALTEHKWMPLETKRMGVAASRYPNLDELEQTDGKAGKRGSWGG